jgi:hypothetical protein
MIHNRDLVETIENAHDAQPFCSCGRHTSPVWRDGAVWLDCASISDTRETRLARILYAVTALSHTHERIVEVQAVAPGAPLGARS